MLLLFYFGDYILFSPSRHSFATDAQIAITKIYQHLCICGDLSLQSTEIVIGLTSYIIAFIL